MKVKFKKNRRKEKFLLCIVKTIALSDYKRLARACLRLFRHAISVENSKLRSMAGILKRVCNHTANVNYNAAQ